MTVASMAQKPTGIASIGLHFPPLAMSVEELAGLRGQEPEKYTIGLGCDEMSLCPPGYGVVELATEAARRALDRWGGDRDRIGMLAVGTETAVDMSRPLSAWVADNLGLKGAVRSYEEARLLRRHPGRQAGRRVAHVRRRRRPGRPGGGGRRGALRAG